MHWFWVLALLLAFWAAMSGELTNPFLVGSGLVTAIAVTVGVTRRGLMIRDWGALRLLRAALTYLPWLLKEVVVANARVIRIVWDPRLPIDPQVFEVPVELHTPTGRVIYANSITLTPGTVTLDAPPDRFLVHSLTREDAEGVLDGAMHARVAALEPPRGPEA